MGEGAGGSKKVNNHFQGINLGGVQSLTRGAEGGWALCVWAHLGVGIVQCISLIHHLDGRFGGYNLPLWDGIASGHCRAYC